MSPPSRPENPIRLSAFCVDVEDWFHSHGMPSPYQHPDSWDALPSHVWNDTRRLLDMLDAAGVRATFMVVGWVAERFPDLVRLISDRGHEIGCHTWAHQLLFDMTTRQFEEDLDRALSALRSISGQPVEIFRAPGFSMTWKSLWTLPILRRSGITTDISIVPAARDHGGLIGFPRDPVTLETEWGALRLFPVSVMRLGGRLTQFSGGGYLRLFPMSVIRRGMRENLESDRPCMCYIHPREIDPEQPRIPLPPPSVKSYIKWFKYYVGLGTTERKLRALLDEYPFGTVSDALAGFSSLPTLRLEAGRFRRGAAGALPA